MRPFPTLSSHTLANSPRSRTKLQPAHLFPVLILSQRAGFVRQFAKLSVQTLVYMLILRTQAIQRLFTHGLLCPLNFSRQILNFSRQIFEQWLIGSADEAGTELSHDIPLTKPLWKTD